MSLSLRAQVFLGAVVMISLVGGFLYTSYFAVTKDASSPAPLNKTALQCESYAQHIENGTWPRRLFEYWSLPAGSPYTVSNEWWGAGAAWNMFGDCGIKGYGQRVGYSNSSHLWQAKISSVKTVGNTSTVTISPTTSVSSFTVPKSVWLQLDQKVELNVTDVYKRNEIYRTSDNSTLRLSSSDYVSGWTKDYSVVAHWRVLK